MHRKEQPDASVARRGCRTPLAAPPRSSIPRITQHEEDHHASTPPSARGDDRRRGSAGRRRPRGRPGHGFHRATAATIQRTFVSTSGNDGNPCTPAAPCRSFKAAIANTSSGGEVVALDSFGYGVFTVDRAITIAGAPGRHVAITAFTGTGVHVNAGENDAVILRNLYVTGLGGETGIFFQAGRTLHLESVVVSGFTSAGLRDRHRRRPDPPQAQLPTQRRKRRLRVRRSPGADRGQPGRPQRRERLLPPQRRPRHDRPQCGRRERAHGFTFWFGAAFTVTDSVADGNVENGVSVEDPDTTIMLRDVVLSNNGFAGLRTSFSATAGRVGGSTVTGNVYGLLHSTGTLESFGDNLVRGNETETSGTITGVAKS